MWTQVLRSSTPGQFCARLCTSDCSKSGLVGGLDRIKVDWDKSFVSVPGKTHNSHQSMSRNNLVAGTAPNGGVRT